MRIAFLIYSLGGGGAEHMLVRLADGMIKRGLDVDIILFDPDIIKYEFNPAISIINAKVEGAGICRDIKRIEIIRKYLYEKAPDILCSFIITTIPYAVFSSLFTRTKVVGAERKNPKAHRAKDLRRLKLTMPLCDGFIFQTKGARDCYSRDVKKKSVIIGNIVPEVKKKSSIGKGYALDVCTVGRLTIQKDYETLFRAFAIVTNVIPKAKLHVYGEGKMYNELAALARTLNISQNVIFEGFSERMEDEYHKYEIFVLSSRAEGMPNALMEAMSAGLACISSDCDYGPSEVIRHGENGLLVPVADVDALATSLIKLITDSNERKRISKNAKKIVEDYSEERILSKYISFFENVINPLKKR